MFFVSEILSFFFFIFLFIFILKIVSHRMTKEQRRKKKILLQFMYFLLYFVILFYVKEVRNIMITWGFSWLGFTMYSKSPCIWSVGSDESSSFSTIRDLFGWASPPQERDIDEMFSLGGKHEAQASSYHLAHEQTDARLPAAGEPAPSGSRQEPTPTTPSFDKVMMLPHGAPGASSSEVRVPAPQPQPPAELAWGNNSNHPVFDSPPLPEGGRGSPCPSTHGSTSSWKEDSAEIKI